MKIREWFKIEDQNCKIGKHHWSVARLIQLSKDLPVLEIPLDHLYIYWTYNSLRPRDFVMHMRAVDNADLSYPIILDEDGELMDGRHRIMKAMLLDIPTIKAVRFDTNPEPCKIIED